ncbi:MAG: phosphodiester glycosidase family protein [bacterium]|nr:phosphodiester glycosidase family protein [bacterium]
MKLLKKKDKKSKQKHKSWLKIRKSTLTFIILDIIALGGLFFAYGPVNYLRNLWITTAMTTMNHRYLAYVFYSDITVKSVLGSNYIVEVNEDVNLDDIVIGGSGDGTFSSEYEKEILTKDPGNDDYKIIPIKGSTYVGYLTAIYDPSKIDLAVTPDLGSKGLNVKKMCIKADCLVGINGGGFQDLDGWGSGGIPDGALIQDGKILWTKGSYGNGLIGFNYDNKLILTYDSPEQAISDGMRDAVEFGPFLIINGKGATIVGNGGAGLQPRTAIAQRKDGIVLFLIIDGRSPGYSLGATYNDVISILLKYGAHNAANLDGGASTTMAVKGQLYNKPFVGQDIEGRYVADAWLLLK